MASETRALPNVLLLTKDVCASLDEVARIDDWTYKNPTNAIGAALERRLASYPEGLECAYGRDRSKHEDEREFLFDFSAIVCEPRDRDFERCTLQLVVAGEVEFGRGLNRDFEKLMYADSEVCFFAFLDKIKEHAPRSETDFFSEIADRRIKHLAARGTSFPPVFVIACYSTEHKRFMTRVVRHGTD